MDDNKKQTTPKTVATIDIKIDWNSVSPREMFLDDYTFCPLCGDELLYTHVTQFVECAVAEEAHCEKCKIRVKQNGHTLQ
jgi:Na+-transporting NADH:ubiquinone oxidoreductase subunit NqrF